MKKKILLSTVFLAMVTVSFSQVYYQEKLASYTVGSNLEKVSQATGWTTNLGDWTVSGKNDGANASSISPVIASGVLSYPGYATMKKVIVCDPTVMGTTTSYRQSILRFSKDAISLTAGSNVVYVSAMINLAGNADTYSGPILGLFKQGTYDVDPVSTLPNGTYSTTWRSRVWAKVTGTQVQFGIHKSSTPTVWSSTTYNLNDTHLLVIKYINNSVSSSGTADEFYLYVDPTAGQTEPDASAYMAAESNSTSGGADLRHVALVSQKLYMKVGQIRVSAAFADVVSADGTYDPNATAINDVASNPPYIITSGVSKFNLISNESGNLSILDLSGKSLLKKSIISNENQSFTYPKGFYMISFKTENGKTYNSKVLIN